MKTIVSIAIDDELLAGLRKKQKRNQRRLERSIPELTANNRDVWDHIARLEKARIPVMMSQLIEDAIRKYLGGKFGKSE